MQSGVRLRKWSRAEFWLRGGNVRWGIPWHHSPSSMLCPRSMGHEGLEGHWTNPTWSTRVCPIELTEFVWGSDILLWNPWIFLISISFPFHKELEAASHESAVKDPLNYIVLFSIHYFWQRWWTCLLTQNWVGPSWEKLYHIKDRVEAGHGCWKAELVCVWSDFLHYCEGAKVAVGKLLWGACSVDVTHVQVHLVSNLVFWCWNSVLVVVLCHVILGLCKSRLCFC